MDWSRTALFRRLHKSVISPPHSRVPPGSETMAFHLSPALAPPWASRNRRKSACGCTASAIATTPSPSSRRGSSVTTPSGHTRRSDTLLSFSGARAFPKPAQRIPVIVGGQTEAALRRAANYGDGWCGFNLTPAETAEKVKVLDRFLAEKGRSRNDLEIFVSPVVTEKPDSINARCRRGRALLATGLRHAVRNGGGHGAGDRGSREVLGAVISLCSRVAVAWTSRRQLQVEHDGIPGSASRVKESANPICLDQPIVDSEGFLGL